MGCTRLLFGIFLIVGGSIMGLFAALGGGIGHILLANIFVVLGLVLLFKKSKK